MRSFKADLHVHTVLSPCAEIEMIPPLIVERALANGISLIAITDHNASANIKAVQKAAEGTDLAVLPGMEVQTKEDVHVICLFDTLMQMDHFQKIVDYNLPTIKNKASFFGHQLIVDETGSYLGTEERLLITSTFLSIDTVWAEVEMLGGLMIPAHINRKVNGLIEILGFVPQEIPIAALEISRHITPSEAFQSYPQIKNYSLIQNGDVHRLNEFLGSTIFEIQEPNILEIRLALAHKEGRDCRIEPHNL